MKNDPRLDAYGTVDELNSFIGLLIEEVTTEDDKKVLRNIQSLLFVVGCCLATEAEKKSPLNLQETDIEMLENEIDKMDSVLPKLSGFILPGGSRSAAVSHICRSVCRRAERCIYHIENMENIDNKLLIFMNRLSDYLFILARKLIFLEKKTENIWKDTCK